MPEAVHNKCTEIQAKFDVCILRLDVDGRRKFMVKKLSLLNMIEIRLYVMKQVETLQLMTIK